MDKVNWLKELFKIEKRPVKGLMAYEWAVLAYTLLTTLFIICTYNKLPNPQALLIGRIRIMAMTGALWLVYRLAPCRVTRLARAVAQLSLLAWWYPDTYELNRILPNFDHLFAQIDQNFFGYQPALLFSHLIPQVWFSELMDLGYASYFPMIVAIVLFYFLFRYEEFPRAMFILTCAFFIYYVVFVFLPVTGPQYYYCAAGLDNVAAGVFPNVGDYFNHHIERMASPGWTDGIFYQAVESAHDAGERPTAAFPSSHVGITMIILMMAWHAQTRRQWLFWVLVPFAVLMFFATVYIQAHYVIDAVAGLLTGILLYILLAYISRNYNII